MAYHDEYLELMSAALDGALSLQETERLEAHLAQCPDCKALYDQLWVATKAVKGLPPVEPPADLTDRIMAAVEKDNATPITVLPKRKQPWSRWLATAAILAIILAGGYGMTQRLGGSKIGVQSRSEAQTVSEPSAQTAPAASEWNDVTTETEGYPDVENSQGELASKNASSYSRNIDTDSASTDVRMYGYDGSEVSQSTPRPSESVTPESAQKPNPESPAQEEPLTASSTDFLLNGGGDSPSTPAPEQSVPSKDESTGGGSSWNGGPSSGGSSASAPHSPSETNAILSFQEAMKLVVSQTYQNSGYTLEVNDFADGTASVCQLSKDGKVIPDTQGRLEYQGLSPNGKYHLFFWFWEGQTAEEAPRFRYAVSLDGSSVIWAGERDDFQTMIEG